MVCVNLIVFFVLDVTIPGPPGPPGPPGSPGYANPVKRWPLFSPVFLQNGTEMTPVESLKKHRWSVKHDQLWGVRCHAVFQITIYTTIYGLSRTTQRAAEGTLAYVSERGGELYIRTQNGWCKIQVCITFMIMHFLIIYMYEGWVKRDHNFIYCMCPCFSLESWSFHRQLRPRPWAAPETRHTGSTARFTQYSQCTAPISNMKFNNTANIMYTNIPATGAAGEQQRLPAEL